MFWRSALLLTGFLCSFHAGAQNSFSDKFKEFQSRAIRDYSDENARMIQAYSDFRDKANAAFAEKMLDNWGQFMCNPPESKVQEIPDIPPVVKPYGISAPREEKESRYAEIIKSIKESEAPEPVIPFLEIYASDIPGEPVTEAPEDTAGTFLFYGTRLKIRFAEENSFKIVSTDNRSLSRLWKKLSEKSYDTVLTDLLRVKDNLDLCDWAYLKMVRRFSDFVFPDRNNESVYLSFYLLSQSGFKVRLAREMNDGDIHLLVGVDGTILEQKYWLLDGVKYFIADQFPEKDLFICNIDYPNENSLRLQNTSSNRFREDLSESRTFRSEYDDLSASCSVNRNLLSFYEDYPAFFMDNNTYSTWKYYADTPLSETVKEALYPALKEAISGKSQIDAVNTILHFVQTAFSYKTDAEVWGKERSFFADETVYYPYCDCEDRAILYSVLVRDLIGLDVVLLYYPGHLAAATNVEEGSGEYYEIDGRKFFVTDPTFINGDLGDTMTSVSGYSAIVIEI